MQEKSIERTVQTHGFCCSLYWPWALCMVLNGLIWLFSSFLLARVLFSLLLSLCVWQWGWATAAPEVYFGNIQICFLLWYNWAIAGHILILDFPSFTSCQKFLTLFWCCVSFTFTRFLTVGVGQGAADCCVINIIFSYPRHFCVLERGLCDLSLYSHNSTRAPRLIKR